MKSLLRLLAISVLFVTTTSADWIIEWRIAGPNEDVTTITKLKGDKMRVDEPSEGLGPTSTITDLAGTDTILLLHGTKQFTQTQRPKIKPFTELKGKAPAKYRATGQREKIGGYDCEIYVFIDGPLTVREWVARDFPEAAGLRLLARHQTLGPPGLDPTTLPGVVLKWESSSGAFPGKRTGTLVSVKEQALAASNFETPAGYQKWALPETPREE